MPNKDMIRPDTVEGQLERRERAESYAVLNERVDHLRDEVGKLNSKFDEALLLCASMAGSVKLGTRALGVIAFALLIFVAGHSAPLEIALTHLWKGLVP